MPRPKRGPRFGGSPQHHQKILANLTAQLIANERVTTTHAKARQVRVRMLRRFIGTLPSEMVYISMMTNRIVSYSIGY